MPCAYFTKRLRFTTMAVRKDWILVLSSPQVTATTKPMMIFKFRVLRLNDRADDRPFFVLLFGIVGRPNDHGTKKESNDPDLFHER